LEKPKSLEEKEVHLNSSFAKKGPRKPRKGEPFLVNACQTEVKMNHTGVIP